MIWVLLAILWVLCAGVAALIAQGKGRSIGGFAMAGLFLGLVGVIWAACAASGERIQEGRRLRQRGVHIRDLQD